MNFWGRRLAPKGTGILWWSLGKIIWNLSDCDYSWFTYLFMYIYMLLLLLLLLVLKLWFIFHFFYYYYYIFQFVFIFVWYPLSICYSLRGGNWFVETRVPTFCDPRPFSQFATMERSCCRHVLAAPSKIRDEKATNGPSMCRTRRARCGSWWLNPETLRLLERKPDLMASTARNKARSRHYGELIQQSIAGPLL